MGKTLVSLKIEVPTQKWSKKTIEQVLSGPTANDYFTCAQYYYQTNNDLLKALEWVNKAINTTKEVDVPFGTTD